MSEVESLIIGRFSFLAHSGPILIAKKRKRPVMGEKAKSARNGRPDRDERPTYISVGRYVRKNEFARFYCLFLIFGFKSKFRS